MVRVKLASVLDSRRLRAVWQSNSFGLIVRFLPRWLKQYMKSVYRKLLVVPVVFSSVECDVILWDHNKPILSVIIPCRNYGRYLRDALQSLESQTFKDFETILVNDGSDDQFTLETLDDLQHEGVRILHQEKLNVAAALNHGIRVARGRYICCFAADDKFEPTYFEKCLCLLESNPGVGFVYSLVRTFGDENEIWLTEPFDLRMLLEYNHVCATAVFKKIVWEKVGGFDVELDGYEDWDFWIKAGEAGFRGRLIPEILFNYRRHGLTLNLKADRKSRTLIKRIRSTHAQIFAHPEEIADIQKSYRDVKALRPFLNLKSKTQYQSSNDRQMIVIAAGMLPHELSSETNPQSSFRPIIVTTDYTACQQGELQRNTSMGEYALSKFLDRYCWLDFLLNLIETRSASLVIISNSELAYKWTPTIKTRASILLVDLIQDQASGSRKLSARYDQFIDIHVVFSENTMNSLAKEIDISTNKIQLLPKCSFLEDDFIDLLQSLSQRRPKPSDTNPS